MSRPNILFLMPDQLRPDFLGIYGATFLKTPNIDRLAEQGTLYETVVSPSPICVPARASMLTGQSAVSTGVIDNLSWLRPDRREMGIETWPELLSAAGYATAAIGKMHFYPWDISEGFQTRVIAEDKRHIHIEDEYAKALADRGYQKRHGNDQAGYQTHKGASVNDLPDDLHVDRWVADQAADYIRNHGGNRPFALMVGFPGPHCPYDPPKDDICRIDPQNLPDPIPPTSESASHRAAMIASYKRPWADLDYTEFSPEEARRIRHHYAALVERLDSDVGRILDTLKSTGLQDNTIVVFASDHGDYLGDFGLIGKTTFHEPSIRVPLIITDYRSPGAARDTALRSLLDLFPSYLDWAGLPPANWADGLPLDTDPSDRVITGMTTLGVMARSATHKLVRYRNGTEALFDLTADPFEQSNLFGQASLKAVQSTLELALADQIIAGTQSGHADKRVPAAQATPPHSFYKREWTRPYPPNKR